MRSGRGPRAGSSRTRQREVLRLVRSDEGDPQGQSGEDREHHGDAGSRARASPGGPGGDRCLIAGGGATSVGAPARRRPPPPLDPAWRAGVSATTTRRGRTTRPAARERRRGTPWVTAGGRTSAAATVSTIPCVAATTLRQYRGGNGARIHGSGHARREERVAGRADREHPRAGRAGDIHAEDEDQERVDLAVEVRAQRPLRSGCAAPPIRRPRRARARPPRVDTSIVTGAGSSNESATSAATPTASVARARVTQSAGAQPVDAVAGEAARQSRVRDQLRR